jgi:hypothetical protein
MYVLVEVDQPKVEEHISQGQEIGNIIAVLLKALGFGSTACGLKTLIT